MLINNTFLANVRRATAENEPFRFARNLVVLAVFQELVMNKFGANVGAGSWGMRR